MDKNNSTARGWNASSSRSVGGADRTMTITRKRPTEEKKQKERKVKNKCYDPGYGCARSSTAYNRCKRVKDGDDKKKCKCNKKTGYCLINDSYRKKLTPPPSIVLSGSNNRAKIGSKEKKEMEEMDIILFKCTSKKCDNKDFNDKRELVILKLFEMEDNDPFLKGDYKEEWNNYYNKINSIKKKLEQYWGGEIEKIKHIGGKKSRDFDVDVKKDGKIETKLLEYKNMLTDPQFTSVKIEKGPFKGYINTYYNELPNIINGINNLNKNEWKITGQMIYDKLKHKYNKKGKTKSKDEYNKEMLKKLEKYKDDSSLILLKLPDKEKYINSLVESTCNYYSNDFLFEIYMLKQKKKLDLGDKKGDAYFTKIVKPFVNNSFKNYMRELETKFNDQKFIKNIQDMINKKKIFDNKVYLKYDKKVDNWKLISYNDLKNITINRLSKKDDQKIYLHLNNGIILYIYIRWQNNKGIMNPAWSLRADKSEIDKAKLLI